ncbi:hypothetical protein [Sphingorhabdus sp.]
MAPAGPETRPGICISLNALYGFGYTLQADMHAMNPAREPLAMSA